MMKGFLYKLQAMTMSVSCSQKLPHLSQVLQGKRIASPSIPRIARHAASKLVTVSIPHTSKEKSRKSTENASDIRACSIILPRAVLSSPDNDELIGKRNRMDSGRPSTVRKCSSGIISSADGKVAKAQEKTGSTTLDLSVGSTKRHRDKRRQLSNIIFPETKSLS